jgi:hypothetical protein
VAGEDGWRVGDSGGPTARGSARDDGAERDDVTQWADGDGGELVFESVDTLIRRLFAVALDLHGALAHLEQHVAEDAAVERIHRAITTLDQTIKDFRGVVFGLRPSGPAASDPVDHSRRRPGNDP